MSASCGERSSSPSRDGGSRRRTRWWARSSLRRAGRSSARGSTGGPGHRTPRSPRSPPRGLARAMRERRPHVTLKAAMTLDGKIADTHGTARWITGERARAHAHRLRSEADAIVVGVATVLRDDPELTVRLDAPWPREPYRVALDTEGRTPPRARFIAAGDPARALVAVGEGGPEERVGPLRAAGATVVRCPTHAA